MEIPSIIILGIIIIYLSKNEKGKQITEHVGDTAVHLAASANKASAALERQCDELLLNDEEAAAAKACAKAKIAKTSKAKAVVNDYDDAL